MFLYTCALSFVSMSGCYLQHLLTEVVNMKNKETKKATIEALDTMIQQVTKGPSGFWVDNYEGCGNPKIFPEFEEGLKQGRLVQKEHYLCPWNTAVLYGKGYGSINNGCYYSCSIDKAKYLSEELMKDVLIRFKKRLIDGAYDCVDNLSPLLTSDEINYIEKEIQQTNQLEEKKYDEERNARLKKASALMQKYPEETELFATHYGEKTIVSTSEGTIDFNPEGYRNIVGAEKFTYDDYIDVQIRSFHKMRGWFAKCYYHVPLGFKGCVEKKTKEKICFERIMINGMYSDGTSFEGKEEHVWMNISGFEKYEIGDCISFFAEVYRYVKTSNGKQINFALRNPKEIKRIEAYKLPSDDDLLAQEISEIICETCYLNEHCNRVSCLLQKGSKKQKEQMMTAIKNCKDTKSE